ncbi:hypothetical protein HBHAL_1523 [Halobacillus halophilus DSM 2266]|uniref:Uncharacterized protein n=1 Tax=Halobacillus halophilus (strain ATCC 35676 / DSM 2266 / JCM 20832 / KCTC 3685 / LMG 17431 / NBRC 102448 / NCIMB 2269) TaxID=866895 RepID=I0JIC5_HALH3|nr:hypothetical protein HBHAL_1523 [Halobacillus halophilus DSM 2266]
MYHITEYVNHILENQFGIVHNYYAKNDEFIRSPMKKIER